MDHLRKLFAEETLLDPRGGYANAVDLIRAIASHFGVPDVELSEGGRSVQELIGEPDHIVFVLIDGLGMNVLERAGHPGLFASFHLQELRALAPSTTACVLTALATGMYPSDHAITGWFTHLPEFNRTSIPLPFTDRASNESLTCYGIQPESVFPCASLLPRINADTRCWLPSEYYDSRYARYWRGESPATGYDDLKKACDDIMDRLASHRDRTFTYLYIPLVDSVSHSFGPDSQETLAAARLVENQMQRLADCLPPKTRLICTADHGQIYIPPENRYLLFDGDPLLDLLRAPPSGEDRFPLFHVEPGKLEAFQDHFHARFSEHFALVPMEEMDALRIFGPGPLSELARSRFGDFAAIALSPWGLGYSPPEKDPAAHHLGRHGGLSPEEMRVPLLIHQG